jgi:AraC family transcriptional activator FtrA
VRNYPASFGGLQPDEGSAAGCAMERDAHAVAIVVWDGVTVFELGVACDIFGDEWAAMSGVPWYRSAVCAVTPGPVSTDSGFRILPAHGLEYIRTADTVIVLPTVSAAPVPAGVLDVLRQAHARGSRIVSLCTGAFALAAAGLLDGRRATTHWAECAELARQHPRVRVDPAVLFVDDGDILTSAGSAASIDLCLHLVRQDHGTEIATQLARQLVVPPQRDGGQAQYIDAPMPALDSSSLFSGTVDWLQEHLGEPVTVEDLAGRSAMSPRTFARRFLASTGTTPYQWLIHQRIQLAQRLLEASDLPIDSVAEKSGFSTAANLRKHFSRAVHTSPQAYRRTFQDRAPGRPSRVQPEDGFLDFVLPSRGERRLGSDDAEARLLEDVQRAGIVAGRPGVHRPDGHQVEEQRERPGRNALAPGRAVDPVRHLGLAVYGKAADAADEPPVAGDRPQG